MSVRHARYAWETDDGASRDSADGGNAELGRLVYDDLDEGVGVGSSKDAAITENDFSPDQRAVYRAILQWVEDKNRPSLTVGGYAGCGKTTILSVLARTLEDRGINAAYAAFTGNASGLLRRRLIGAGCMPKFCGTIHRLIYTPQDDGDGGVSGWFRRDDLPFDLIVIDEGSMVGTDVWNDLREYNKKILVVGDHGQLPPVGTDQINLMASPDLRLEKIHRQAEGNPILKLSAEIRASNRPQQTLMRFPDDAEGHIRHLREDDAYAWMEKQFRGPVGVAMHSTIICGRNKLRTGLNAYVREHLSDNPILANNDIVMCLKNVYNVKGGNVLNGMRGFVTRVHKETDLHVYADIRFPDQRATLSNGKMLKAQFGRATKFDNFTELSEVTGTTIKKWSQVGLLFDYGFAMTCHKAQAQGFPDVAVVADDILRGDNDRDGRRWAYTAVTRCSQRLVVIV